MINTLLPTMGANGSDPGGGDPPKDKKRLMQDWNGFVSYLDERGMRGHKDLDLRDKQLSRKLMGDYRQQNPSVQLTYDDVPQIQQEFQNYRNRVITDLKTGKGKLDGIAPNQYEAKFGKDFENFWPEISKVDGWVGSKTSKWMFPSSYLNRTDDGVQTVQNRGLVNSLMY